MPFFGQKKKKRMEFEQDVGTLDKKKKIVLSVSTTVLGLLVFKRLVSWETLGAAH